MNKLLITWFGHSTFLLRTPGGKRVLLDPWFAENPACPASMKKPPRPDLILVSHGHGDHIGDLISVARDSTAPVVGPFELCDWVRRKGITNVLPMNKGGAQEVVGLRIVMTDARHSSGYVENGQMIYMGEPAGYVIGLEDGMVLYFAGDTSLFGDMKLIGEMYRPDVAFVPIGDRFTMDPSAAAKACELLSVRVVVPMHWGTFPLLTGTPDALKQLIEPSGVKVLELKPGETSE